MKNAHVSSRNIIKVLLAPLLVVLVAVVFFVMNTQQRASVPMHANTDGVSHELTVYKSPTCGCCGIHADYLERQGYRVERVDTEDMDQVKQRFGVPEELFSCHTTVVNDGQYFIEGHIPAEAVAELLETEPDISGIGMPGMPSGSPGMPGPKDGPFEVMQLDNTNQIEIFMSV